MMSVGWVRVCGGVFGMCVECIRACERIMCVLMIEIEMLVIKKKKNSCDL